MSSTTTDQVTIDVDNNELIDANKSDESNHLGLIAVDGRRHNRHGSNGSHHHNYHGHSGGESDADDRHGSTKRQNRRRSRSRSRSKSPSHRSKRNTETAVSFATLREKI